MRARAVSALRELGEHAAAAGPELTAHLESEDPELVRSRRALALAATIQDSGCCNSSVVQF